MPFPVAVPLQAPPDRPLGVWIITAYVGLFAGLLPLSVLHLVPNFFALGVTEHINGLLSVLGDALLAAGILLFALGAWWGASRARDGLVALASVHYLAQAYNASQLAFHGLDAHPSPLPSGWGAVLLPVLILAVVVCYMKLSGLPDAFYEQSEGEEHE